MRAAALALLAACWSAPKPPGLAPIPGLLWISDAQPMRVPHFMSALAADGDALVAVGGHGWIARISLADAHVIREARIGRGALDGVLRIDAGHWLVTGTDHERAVAWVVDQAFAATPIALPVQGTGETFATTRAVRTPAGIAIVGPGLPLALYDPATWRVRTTLDRRLSWTRAVTDGKQLVAQRDGETLGFDLATGQPLPASWFEAAAGTITVRTQYTAKGQKAEVRDGTRVRFEVPAPITTLRLDDDGTRLFVFGGTALRVYDVASGKLAARYELGESARGAYPSLVVAGHRVVVPAHAVLRVVDLDTGAITPEGAPPYGTVPQLVTAGDDVLAIDRALWRLRGGALVETREVRDGEPFTLPRGELRRFATADVAPDGKTFVTLRAGASVVHRWPLDGHANGGWLGESRDFVVDVISNDLKPSAITRTEGDELAAVVPHTDESVLDDVDVDSWVGLLDQHGEVHVVHLKNGGHATPALRIPGCDTLGKAMLEPGGKRAATVGGDSLVLWDRDTATPIATLRAPDWIGQVIFLPGTDDVLLDYGEDVLAVWSPRAGTMRAIALGRGYAEDISADGTRLALGFVDGRVALVDLRALVAAMKPVAVGRADVPEACPGPDPFEVAPPVAEPAGDGVDDGGD